ncbi:MAG: endolytic transglycosylase MltG [Thermoleophilia bacterium]|nr:endolytic transglycosylase MltG [Thermoleophilia bacterium]
MSDRWFEDAPMHDPDDPEAVERALRRQERANKRHGGKKPKPAKGPEGGGHRPSRGRLIAIGAAALVAILFVWFLFAFFQPFTGDGDGAPFNVKVPQGASVGDIGDQLVDEGVVSNAMMFELKATVTGKRSKLFFGNHFFKENMSYSSALDELGRKPDKVTISVTIPEGLSRSETADVVAAAKLPGDYMGDSVKSDILDPDEYGADGKAENLEGFLFPATYELKPGSDTKDLVDQQLEAFKENIAGVDMKYARKKNLTVYDVLTIASMVEREVQVPKERKTVAAVIYNRLKMGEPLFIDATIRFAVDNWTEPLTESDLAVDSPYNTRTNQGLPPGPIGNPGIDSIDAAANPEKTDVWLYVVKPGTCGEHAFSSSLEEHDRNVEKYQQAQEEAGGSPDSC